MGNMAAPGKLLGMARRYDIRVTEKLNIKGVTRKASILSVGFGTLCCPQKPSSRPNAVLNAGQGIRPGQTCLSCWWV
jgi:hypothetical protein